MKEQQQLEIINHQTKLIGFVGGGQSGKGTSTAYFTGLTWHLNNLIERFEINQFGQLVIYDLKGHVFSEGKVFDTFTWHNDPEIDSILRTCFPPPLNLVQKVSFGDALKEVCHLMFGIHSELLWGDDKAKGTETEYTAGQFRNLLGTGRFPFKDMKDSETLTVRQILQVWGTEVGRRISTDLWTRRLTERVYDIINTWRPAMIVIDDVRFESEVECIKKMNGTLIGLTRKVKSSAGTIHASEKITKLFEECDHVVDNQDDTIVQQCSKLFDIYREVERCKKTLG